MRNVFTLVVAIAFVFSCLSPFAMAQDNVVKVVAGKAVEQKPLSIRIELAPSAAAENVVLRYRPFGQSEFKAIEATLSGNAATAVIPAAAVMPPSVEYYFEITKRGAPSASYPVGAPQAALLRAAVSGANPKDAEVRFLSPEPGATVAAEDLVIAISFFYASPAVDIKQTRLSVDGVDVSSKMVVSDDVILYSPQNFGRPLPKGAHFLKLELRDTLGKAYHTMDASFNLSTAAEIAEAESALRTMGSAQLEVRNEAMGTGGTTYVRGDVRFDGTYSSLGFGSSIHLDNQNTTERQPQNRFLVYGQTDFLRIEVGDAFPRMPSNIVSGKRVRGVTGALTLGFFNLDVSVGQTERKVEGVLSPTAIKYADSAAIIGRPANMIEVADSTFRAFTPGTFTRNFLAIRPSFGSSESFQWGLTYLRSKDDVGSVTYGGSPQENMVVGTDVMFAADDQRVRFDAQAALSLFNTDISGGSLTDADYDLLETNLSSGEQLRKIGNVASKFITFNQYLFPTNPFGTGAPALAVDASLSLNYLNNFVRGAFFRRGAAYKSFGNEFLQTDIAGFAVSDNIRLFSNRVFAALSYERKQDNTAKNKEVTTDYNNLNANFSFLLGADLPTVQIGYGRYSRKAPIDLRTQYELLQRPDSTTFTQSLDDATNRFFFGGSYDFEAGMRHSMSLSVNMTNRTDNTFRKRDQSSLYLQTGVTTDIGGGLQTNVGIVYSKNQIKSRVFYASGKIDRDSVTAVNDFNYTVLTLGAQWRTMEDQLRLLASFLPTMGAYSRHELLFGAEYTPWARHTFLLQADLYQNSGFKDDAIISFIYRMMF